MSRSDYYPRKRSRIQPPEPKQAPKDTGEGRPPGIGSCAVCDVDLPVVQHDGLYYVQSSLAGFCGALQTQVCPWKLHLETRTPKERLPALSFDCAGITLFTAPMDSEGMV